MASKEVIYFMLTKIAEADARRQHHLLRALVFKNRKKANCTWLTYVLTASTTLFPCSFGNKWQIIILELYLETFKRGYLSSLAKKFYLCQIT